ncbi:MAG TPA: hypothetical protein VHZ51_27445 [Ktedonobacteraceae bacterium]|nr:hypothetical protein [Ktedonobacteraceae bacterium]
MRWLDRLRGLPATPRVQVPQISGSSPTSRVREQVSPTFFSSSPTQEDWYWGRLATGGEEDYYWRRLSDNFYQKDVIPSTYLEIHNHCYEAYNANPLASSIIELTTSFVLGEGLTVSAHDQRVQTVLDAFWQHPENHMDERVYSLCTELSLFGEQFVRFFVNRYDGSVIIRQIDPSLIDEIETDPEDVEKPLRYHRRPAIQPLTITLYTLSRGIPIARSRAIVRAPRPDKSQRYDHPAEASPSAPHVCITA